MKKYLTDILILIAILLIIVFSLISLKINLDNSEKLNHINITISEWTLDK